MSASSKKKLRSAEDAKKMTEKQLTEQKEAKKLQLYTVAVVALVVVMVVAAIGIVVSKSIDNSGINQRKTIAATVGDHQLSNAELSYFYLDSINKFVNNYGSYASAFGLDTSKPLNAQFYDEENNETWADYFTASAVDSAKATYALTDAAKVAGHTLSEDEKSSIESSVTTMQLYGSLNGYPSLDSYLKAIYGNGANEAGYRNYVENSTLAQSYAAAYADSLTYTDDQLREAEKENFNQYSVFSYNSYYLATSKFLGDGTSDADKAAAAKAAEAAAKSLTGKDITDVAALDAAIAALEINKDATSAASTAYTKISYTNVNSTVRDWVTSSSRKAGDVTYLANTTSTVGEDGNETTTVSGYYVVFFNGSNDNKYPLANVRHILVTPEGGTTDSNGSTTYTDEAMAAAKAKAEDILATWKAGAANEESFAALAAEESTDPGSAENGGLYEDVYPGQMVANFNDWCFAEGRKAGDTGIVESNYGYHVMFYSGDSSTTYRDFLITNTLQSEDYTAWYTDLINSLSSSIQNTKYLRSDIVLSNG